MCVLVSVLQKEKDSLIINSLTSPLAEMSKGNNDGSGVLAFNLEKKKVLRHRQLDVFPKQDIQGVLNAFPVSNFHFRTATVGDITLQNVHFWENQDWSFAHNGHAYGLGVETTAELSDSYLLFRELYNKGCLRGNGTLNLKKIKKILGRNLFWGRFILTNKKHNLIYYFGDFDLFLINKKTLVISSQSLEIDQYINFMGLLFKDEDADQDLKKLEVLEGNLEGIACFNMETQNIEILDETPLKELVEQNTKIVELTPDEINKDWVEKYNNKRKWEGKDRKWKKIG